MSFDKWKMEGLLNSSEIAQQICIDSLGYVEAERLEGCEELVFQELMSSLPELPDPSQNYLQLRNKRGKGKGRC